MSPTRVILSVLDVSNTFLLSISSTRVTALRTGDPILCLVLLRHAVPPLDEFWSDHRGHPNSPI